MDNIPVNKFTLRYLQFENMIMHTKEQFEILVYMLIFFLVKS